MISDHLPSKTTPQNFKKTYLRSLKMKIISNRKYSENFKYRLNNFDMLAEETEIFCVRKLKMIINMSSEHVVSGLAI